VIGEARRTILLPGKTIQVSAIRKLSTFIKETKMLITGIQMMVPLLGLLIFLSDLTLQSQHHFVTMNSC
jgi:hypothetical protein